jgi:hypothetical protein
VAKKNKRSAKEAKGKRQKAKVVENPKRSDRIKKAKGKRQKT